MSEPITHIDSFLPEEMRLRRDRLKSGGGDGTSDGMEARVKALEDRFEKIDAKLGTIGSDLAYIKGKLEGAPSAKDFGELKGRVDSLPTTAKVAGIIAIVGGVVALLLRWEEISRFIGS